MLKLFPISILLLSLFLTVNVKGEVLIIETDPKLEENLKSITNEPVIEINISGQYTSNIPDDNDLLVEFKDNKVTLLNGCNINFAQFNAYSNGSISFGPFVTTRKFCNPDFDAKYTSTLSTSFSFDISS